MRVVDRLIEFCMAVKQKPWAEEWMTQFVGGGGEPANCSVSVTFLQEVYGWYAKQFDRTSIDHPYRNVDKNQVLVRCEKQLQQGIKEKSDPIAEKIKKKSEKRTKILESITKKQSGSGKYSTFQCFVDTMKLSWYAPTKKEVEYIKKLDREKEKTQHASQAPKIEEGGKEKSPQRTRSASMSEALTKTSSIRCGPTPAQRPRSWSLGGRA